jgi:uncharacterized membrane protein YoaK (UPF0700 family)
VNLLDQHYLWASMIWGAIAGGYLVYGWRQKATWPLAAGALMTVVSIFMASALLMSLICIAVMFAVWWLAKQGY